MTLRNTALRAYLNAQYQLLAVAEEKGSTAQVRALRQRIAELHQECVTAICSKAA